MFRLPVFLCFVGLMVFLHACGPRGNQTSKTSKPNVLLILTDDQGYGDLSLHGNPYIKTPHLDQLGRQGVRFDRFYVSAVCAPTRAALLTGRYPLRAGVHGVTRNQEALRPGEVTFGDAFKAAGYETGYFGKWHNGSQYPNTPPGKGFDEFLGFTSGHVNNYFDAVLLRGTKEEATSGFITDVLTNEALHFMTKAKDAGRPFLCYLNYNAPHNPYQVPDSYYDPVFAVGLPPQAAGHFAMCKNIDDNVGRLLAQLESLGITENTIVVFLSDNGIAPQIARFYNAGMRGSKTSTHEGGTRVPFFIHWPAAGWEPQVIEELAEHVDLYPTLVDLCGIELAEGPPIDGRSLRALIEQSDDEWPSRTLFTHNGIDRSNRYPGAVRTPRYRLLNTIEGPQAGSQAKNRDATRSPWMLFDMVEDPAQTTNIADQHPELVEELAKEYEDWLDGLYADPPQRWPLPIGHDAHNPVRLHASQATASLPIAYHVGGFAHDWLTHWTSVDGSIQFPIEVVKPGSYAITLIYTCHKEDAGSQISVQAGDASTTAIVPAFETQALSLPNRDETSNERYLVQTWGRLPVGTLSLKEGPTTLSLKADSMTGNQVMELLAVEIEKLGE